MGRSILLKDKKGRILGYVIYDGQYGRVKITGASGACLLILLDEHGRRMMYPVRDDGMEECFACDHEPLYAAVLNESGKFLLSDGQREIREEWMERASVQLFGCDDEARSGRDEDDEDMEEREERKEKEERPTPERRWPPPPCMQNAVYEDGRWQTI